MLTGEELAATGELAASLARPVVTASGLLPGLHPGIDAGAYHFKELGVVSNSALEEVRRSPAHYLAWVAGHERKETPALSFGRALHMRALEPDVFARTYVIAPDFGDRRYKAAKDAYAAWSAEHAGATILDAASGHVLIGMIESIANHPIARPLLEGGEAELTMRWDDEATGLAAKGRADFYRADLRTVADVKSAQDASLDAFRRSVATHGYHRQEAHYRRGFARLNAGLDHFVFIVVEKSPPFAVAVYALDVDAVALGERQTARASRTLCECLKCNEWPGYPDTIQTLQLPPWVKDDEP